MSDTSIPSSLSSARHSVSLAAEARTAKQPVNATQQAFQDFVAGTFYKQMLKALRSTQQSVQYMDGGQAEQAFRSQLDQQISEDLARSHGDVFAEGLYDGFQRRLEKANGPPGSQLDYFA